MASQRMESQENAEAPGADQDEVFFDHLKDQFAFFYALTVAGMDLYDHARADRPQTGDDPSE